MRYRRRATAITALALIAMVAGAGITQAGERPGSESGGRGDLVAADLTGDPGGDPAAGATAFAVAPYFSDVPRGAPFHTEISWLVVTEIGGGYPDGTFRPGGTVSRQAMAAFLFRLERAEGWAPPSTATFDDVPPGHPFFTEIEWLTASGITAGYADGTFRPGATVSRQAMAAFLYRLVDPLEPALPTTPTFADVPADSPFFAAVEWLDRTGITTGYPDGTFRPGATVSRQAMAAFLRRAADRVPGRSQIGPVAGGGDHSLAVSRSGRVHSWGGNGSGQLGIGTTEASTTPVPVPGMTNILAVSAGRDFSLALTAFGQVFAWGRNDLGQLGVGTTTPSSVPVLIPGLSEVVAISAGDDFAMALTESGDVYAWGSNGSRELGDGTTASYRATPALVPSLSGATAIAAGGRHGTAVVGGQVLAWGSNSHGQLGDGTTTDRPLPQPVPGLSDAVVLAAGYAHTVAVVRSAYAYAWGANATGQLGDGTTQSRFSPKAVSLGDGVAAVATGDSHSAAVSVDGYALTWGGNGYGQLGNGTTTGVRLNPGGTPGPDRVIGVSAGWNHTLAMTAAGEVYAWGNNGTGQVGDGSTTVRSSAVSLGHLP